MKIGEITPFFVPYPGGQEIHCYWISHYLAGIKNNQVTVITSDYPKVNGLLKIERLKNLNIKRIPLSFQIYSNPFCMNLFFYLFKEQIDVFHVHGFWSFYTVITALVSLLRKIPLVLSFHGYQDNLVRDYGILGKLILNTYLTVTKPLFKRTIKGITCNHVQDKQKLVSMGFNEEIIKIIPSGMQVHEIVKDISYLDEFKNKYTLVGKKVLLFVGRLIKRKGVHNLIDIFLGVKKKFKDAVLLVIGSGEMEDSLKNQVKKRGIEKDVKFLGYVKPFSKLLTTVYQASDIFLLPSFSESMPRTILEALSHKLPVVTSNRSFSFWLKKDLNCAILANPKDSSEFSQKICNLLEHEELREELILNGLELLRREFDWKKIARDTTRLFREKIKI